MILKKDRPGGGVRCIPGELSPHRAPVDLGVVLHEDAIEEDRDASRLDDLFVFEARRAKDDIVRLPFTRLW